MNLELELNRLKRNSEAAWARMDYEKSEELLRQRHKLLPQDPTFLLDLGHQRGLRFDFAGATDYFEKAIRASGWNAAALLAAGFHCLSFSQPELARNYFERALKKSPADVEVLAALALIHERLGQLDTAAEYALRAVQLNASHPVTRLVQAKVLRRRKQLAEAESILRSVIHRPAEDAWTTAQLGYELGQNLDQQGRYDEAMAAFVDAKKKLSVTSGKTFGQAWAAEKQRLAEATPAYLEMLRRVRANPVAQPAPQRIAFLVGHPRSGTTLLEQVLDTHSDVISSEETVIFTREAILPQFRNLTTQQMIEVLENPKNEAQHKARINYFRLTENFLGTPVAGRLLIDKNPSLTSHIPAITRIFPETRFLVALRDPRDVCLSCFMQPIPVNPVSYAYLSLADTATEYASLMGFWLTIRDQLATPWLEVRYEDMVNDLEPVARRTLEFLGLPWDDRVLAFHQHVKTKIVRSPTYADVGKPIYKSAKGRWLNYAKHLEPQLAQLEPFVKAFGYQ